MSGADGFDVLSTLAKVDPGVPIVVVSGLNTAWTAAAALRLGAVDYVTKPFDEEALVTLVREVLTSSRKPRGIPGICRVILVGLDLGVYAALTVLLRESCKIERVPTIADTLTRPSYHPPDVLVAHIDSLGTDAAAAVRRVREFAPTTHVAVIAKAAAHETPLLGCQLLHAPGRASDVLRLVLDHLRQPSSLDLNLRRSVCSALDYLCQHLATASVRGMGQAVGAAPHYLSTLFREDIGSSPRAFIAGLRIEAAKYLLLETGEKIDSVAARIGLHDASHLSRLFVKQTGRRPGVYRGRTPPMN